MVEFQLRFNGSQGDEKVTKDIYDIIERGVTKIHFGDVIYVLLRHFLVDIRFNWKMPYGENCLMSSMIIIVCT